MHQIQEIIVIVIIIIVLGYYYDTVYGLSVSLTENFLGQTQNFVYTNKNNIANQLEYGSKNVAGIYQKPLGLEMGPSQNSGVNDNSRTDVFDNRGYKWTENAKNPEVDELTWKIDDQQLKQNFERTYMLDPDGSVAQYDITNNKISPNCCPAQYSPPFKLTDKDESNCDYAQKYVANQYSGMNFADGYGCVCMTPKQATFFGNRGGNTQ
jgi:hypothetical protein